MKTPPFYKDYSTYLAQFFEGKVQKITVDTGATCPNRDGTFGNGGCIYCNNASFSPDFAKRSHPITEQIDSGKQFFGRKYPMMRYLVYFQSYTSTYGKGAAELISNYRTALYHSSDIVGIVIGTRPDCMPQSLLEALKELQAESGKKLFIEYGAETSHNTTLRLINRCHTWECVTDAIERTASAGIETGAHFIMGLPGEHHDDFLATIDRINTLPLSCVKFHHLQILRGTPLAKAYGQGANLDIETFTPESYAALCAEIVRNMRHDIAIDRFVAQVPPEMLIAPQWGIKNYQFTQILNNLLAKS